MVSKEAVVFKKPNQKDFDTAHMCVVRGLEEAEKAIKLDPNNESAWSYKTNLLVEAARLAEMDGKLDQKAQYSKQADEARKRATVLSDERRKKEEQAIQAATPAG